MIVTQLKIDLKKLGSKKKAEASAWFFKTGKGQYGFGDKFIGVSVPNQRFVARKFNNLEFVDIEKLLKSPIHEERLVALLILVDQFKKADDKKRSEIYKFYLKNINRVNNWDLVDLSAPNIVGVYLIDKPKTVLYKMAKSKNLWGRRIAAVSTLAFIQKGNSEETFKISLLLLNDKEDLIHKVVGWMLREVGKRISRDKLKDFLKVHYKQMPRTMLRYAIEHFGEDLRQKYLQGSI